MDVAPIAISRSKGKVGGARTACSSLAISEGGAHTITRCSIFVGHLPPIEKASARQCRDGGRSSVAENESDGQPLEPALEQLATHVPDLIVFRSHDAPLPQTIHSYGVVMFTDISGNLSTWM